MVAITNLRPWEKVVVTIKRHWIVFVSLAFYLFFAVILNIMTFVALWTSYIIIASVSLFSMFMLLFLYIKWLNHELDMFIITNNRIIWVEQISFLNRTISECNLWQVQEVNAHTKWLFSNIFDYWDITIQTAWNATNFEMTYAPNAMRASRLILNVVDSYRDDNKDWNAEYENIINYDREFVEWKKS